MTLIKSEYLWEQNHILAKCKRCGQLCNALAAEPTVFKCKCGKTEFDKLPLYYLIHNNPDMIVFLATSKAGKNFVGFTFDEKDTQRQTQKIKKELTNIMNRNVYPDLAEDLREYGLDSFKLKVLGTPKTCTQAMVLEKLSIKKYNAMEPDGYNTCYVLEILNKPVKQ